MNAWARTLPRLTSKLPETSRPPRHPHRLTVAPLPPLLALALSLLALVRLLGSLQGHSH